jgi:hypothetical protein
MTFETPTGNPTLDGQETEANHSSALAVALVVGSFTLIVSGYTLWRHRSKVAEHARQAGRKINATTLGVAHLCAGAWNNVRAWVRQRNWAATTRAGVRRAVAGNWIELRP